MTTTNQAVKTFNQRRATFAALANEQVTRERVDRLERWLFGWAGKEPQDIEPEKYGLAPLAPEMAFRLDQLERGVERIEHAVSCSPGGGLHQLAMWQNTTWHIVMERGLWGRLRWLFLGH